MAYFPGTQSFRQPYPRKRTEQGGDNRRAMTANGLPNIMARGLPVPGREGGNRKPVPDRRIPPGWDQGNAWWKKQSGMTPFDKMKGPRRGEPMPGGYPGRDAGRPNTFGGGGRIRPPVPPVFEEPIRQPMPYFPPGQTPPWGGPGGGGMTPWPGGGGMTPWPGGGGMLDLIVKLLGGGPFIGR